MATEYPFNDAGHAFHPTQNEELVKLIQRVIFSQTNIGDATGFLNPKDGTFIPFTGGPVTTADWGEIGGSLADQLDLQAVLDGKAPTAHTHTAANITNFSDAVAGMLQAGANISLNYVAGVLTIAVTGISAPPWGTITGNIADQTDLVAEFNGKSDVGHTHTASSITDFATALASLLAEGSGISLTVGGGGVITISAEDVGATWGNLLGDITDQADLMALFADKSDIDHTHGNATTSVAGFMSAADKSKLDGVEANATANSSDADLLDRANHTGTQAISTVVGLQTALDGKAASVHTHTSGSISDFAEAVDDRVGSLLDAGTGIVITYDDVNDLLTVELAASGVAAGSYGSATEFVSVTVDTYGRVTAISEGTMTPAWADITGKPTFPAGAIVGTTDAQTLTNKTLDGSLFSGTVDLDSGSVRQDVVAMGALNIDCSLGNYFTKTIASNSTFTISNIPASKSYCFALEITHTSGTITWPSSFRWPDNTAPTLTTGKTHVVVGVTDDTASIVRASILKNYNNS